MGKASLLMFGSQFFEVTSNSESLARSWCTPSFCLSPLQFIAFWVKSKDKAKNASFPVRKILVICFYFTTFKTCD